MSLNEILFNLVEGLIGRTILCQILHTLHCNAKKLFISLRVCVKCNERDKLVAWRIGNDTLSSYTVCSALILADALCVNNVQNVVERGHKNLVLQIVFELRTCK